MLGDPPFQARPVPRHPDALELVLCLHVARANRPHEVRPGVRGRGHAPSAAQPDRVPDQKVSAHQNVDAEREVLDVPVERPRGVLDPGQARGDERACRVRRQDGAGALGNRVREQWHRTVQAVEHGDEMAHDLPVVGSVEVGQHR
jgi:hypothetical protein